MEIQLTFVQSIGLAVVFLMIGNLLVNNSKALKNSSIPAAVFGGLIFAVINMIGYLTDTIHIVLEGSASTFFMIFFFTTIGYNVSLRAVKNTGNAVIILLILTALGVILQNVVAIGIGNLFDLDPLISLLMGSPSLVGGHGTVAAVAPTIEELGYPEALTVGQVAATLGVAIGSLVSAPIGSRIIEKNNLSDDPKLKERKSIEEIAEEKEESGEDTGYIGDGIYSTTLWIFVAMFLGFFVTDWINSFIGRFVEGISFPVVLGPMIIGFIIRNISDSLKDPLIDEKGLEILSVVSLDIFLALSITGLKLWQIIDIAIPMIVVILGVLFITAIFSFTLGFRMLGRDYDAAIMATGYAGYALGSSSNAMASMRLLTQKYYPAPDAILAVSVISGLFLDFMNVVMIYATIPFLI